MKNPAYAVGEDFDERANEDGYFAAKELELIEENAARVSQSPSGAA